MDRATPTTARAASARKVTASAWAEVWRNAPAAAWVVYAPASEATRVAMARLVTASEALHYFPCEEAHQARARDLQPQPS